MNSEECQVILGDCLNELDRIEPRAVDVVYMDPPFFTNRRHTAITRDRSKAFEFDDAWSNLTEYAHFMEARLLKIHELLKDTGSVFVHCDTHANFLLRALLDKVFGPRNFQSEIVWTYRRWSNSAKGLLPAHQTILFYSKTESFKFNRSYTPYSESTNVDQILQLRQRDSDGVSKYATDEDGNVRFGAEKKGVPLSDVWDIPFLNPKAKERAGYPTQKPILLLERIITMCSDPGDLVVDPFCGSGTTLVAAAIHGRRGIGIDTSKEAVELTKKRLSDPIKTESALLEKGRSAYDVSDKEALAVLYGLDVTPVHRNSGIDAFLKINIGGSSVPVRIQRRHETLTEAASKLSKATSSKTIVKAILIRTGINEGLFPDVEIPDFIEVIDATSININSRIAELIHTVETVGAAL